MKKSPRVLPFDGIAKRAFGAFRPCQAGFKMFFQMDSGISRKFLKCAFLLLLLCTAVPASAGKFDAMPADQFVRVLRTPPGRESWGRLAGEVSHRRRGAEEAVVEPISFRVLFTERSTVAQLVFRKTELCQLTQSYLPPYAAAVETNGKSTLEEVGLRPEDLTMSFLFWNFKGEGGKISIRAQDCRTLDFESPSGAEKVRAYVSSDYIFPVRVEWLGGDGKPFRTLDVNEVKKVGELWVVEELSVSGSGWRTRVRFTDFSAGYSRDGIPEDLFAE